MVKLYNDGKLWLVVNGKRRGFSIQRLLKGRKSRSQDRAIANIVRIFDELETASHGNVSPDPKTVEELRNMEWLEAKAVEFGLIKEQVIVTVEQLLDFFIKKNKSSWKKTTLYKWNVTTRTLVIGELGADKKFKEVTRGDADDLKANLSEVISKRTEKKISESHVSKMVANTRTLFGFAVKRGLLAMNPFDHIKRGNEQGDTSKRREVTAEVMQRVINAAPDAEWRLAIVMWRYTGARKSEPMNMKVRDVYLGGEQEGSVMHIVDAKLGHIKEVPVFPEIMPYLIELLELRSSPDEYLFPTLRRKGERIDKAFRGIIKKAGCEIWPRLFNNLRATRANEIERVHGGLLESKWVGHSSKTFMKHYGNVQQADIVAACGTVANTLQHGGAPGGTEPPRTEKKGYLPLPAPQCNLVQMASVPPLGLEPRTL